MEISLRYGFDSQAFCIHGNQKLSIHPNSLIQMKLNYGGLSYSHILLLRPRRPNWNRAHHHHHRRHSSSSKQFLIRASESDHNDPGDSLLQSQATDVSSPPPISPIKRSMGLNIAIGVAIAVTVLGLGVRLIMANNKSRDNNNNNHAGSVADLVRRGQLRSDRRGISKPLKYDDPFNNPMVKVGKSNSTVEMCGKIYRLAPVTLTEEQQSVHQKRRSRAYQWKRPTVFLKEGDTVPPEVDPDTVRWIPANHPFATTVSDIDEDSAQNNVRQKHGVPFRIRAEHEALQRKLEALQDEQKLNKVTIDSSNAKDFERAYKSNPKPSKSVEENGLNEEIGNSPLPERWSNSSSEEMQKP